MNPSLRRGLEAGAPINSLRGAQPTRERVLEVACELFAEFGFHGTHLREICKRAGTNVAGVCYYFHSKERLYEAVSMEAGRRLCEPEKTTAASESLPPDHRLLHNVNSLLKRLGEGRAWPAKLLARELVDSVCGAHSYAASGMERDFVLLQAVMKDLVGAKVGGPDARFQALSLIAECVFYTLTGEKPHHPATQSFASFPSRAFLARLLTERSLGALRGAGSELEGAKL